MALSRDLRLAIDEVVLDGVEPDDPLVYESLASALAPSLGAQGHEAEVDRVAAAASAALEREISA